MTRTGRNYIGKNTNALLNCFCISIKKYEHPQKKQTKDIPKQLQKNKYEWLTRH